MDKILLEQGVQVHMPTIYGDFQMIPFLNKTDGKEHIVLWKKERQAMSSPIVRVHSSCCNGDIFGSLRCDCGEQLHMALRIIEEKGGLLIYLDQEGRGIGLMDKMKAYKLQEQGLDTVDANLAIGRQADERDYGVAATILQMLGIEEIYLLTNNPSKRLGLSTYGIKVLNTIPIETKPNQYDKFYLETKQKRMGHKLHVY